MVTSSNRTLKHRDLRAFLYKIAGTAKFLSDILEAAQEQMLDRMKANEAKMSEITDPEKTADVVGVSAVVVQDFSAKRVKDYGFNLERATAAEGDTGPYLQYAHARLSSMERKNDVKISDAINFQLLNDKEALDLMMKLARLPEVVRRTSEENEPCTLVTYLMVPPPSSADPCSLGAS